MHTQLMVVWRAVEEAEADEPSAKRLTLSHALFTAASDASSPFEQETRTLVYLVLVVIQIAWKLKSTVPSLHLKNNFLCSSAKRAHPSVALTLPAIFREISCTFTT